MIKIYIIILSWNNYDDTKETIESLLKSDLLEARILLVDNASTDGSFEKLKKEFESNRSVKMFLNSHNDGFAGGNNIGIKKALAEGADYILLLNNDVIVKKDFLSLLFKNANILSNAGIVAPRIYYYNNKNIVWSDAGFFNKLRVGVSIINKDRLIQDHTSNPVSADFVSGCSMLIKSNVFKDIGFFDEDFFFYSEDMDLCFRAKDAGYAIYLVPDSKIYHKVSKSMGDMSNPLYVYYQVRNRLLLSKKHFSLLFFIYAIIFTEVLYIPYLLIKSIRSLKVKNAFFSFFYAQLGVVDMIRGKRGKL